VFYFKPFINNSIFIFDPLKNDQLIKKISTVPSQVLSKIYENKTTIPTQKYISNLFLTIDLNNYFFAFHPREIVQENQNLHKYPFAAIIPFLIGLYIIFDKNNQKIKKITLTLFTLSALSLGFINNIDKFDFILYIPVTTITLLGLKKIFSMKNNSVILLTFILFIFSAIDLVKLFIN
jgi:hypothetical protein